MEKDVIFKEIPDLISRGKRKEATEKSWAVFKTSSNDLHRLQAILFLIVLLDKTTEIDTMIELCVQGITMSKNGGNVREELYLKTNKASLLLTEVIPLVREKKFLKLPPGWKQFSLLKDEERFNELHRKITSNIEESEKLMLQAINASRESGDSELVAQISMAAGNQYSEMAALMMLEHLKGNTFLLKVLKHSRFIRFVSLTRKQRREFNRLLDLSEQAYLEAAAIFKKLNSKLNQAYCLFNIANQLSSHCEFKRAKKHLMTAKKLALGTEDKHLLYCIGQVEDRIRTKAKSVPDHITRLGLDKTDSNYHRVFSA